MGEPRDFSDPRYKSWRRRVYARDKYKCRMPGCPGTDKRLNAHHIKCWSSHPALRYEVANGISVCRDCHLKLNGNEEQFEAVLSRVVSGATTDNVVLRMIAKRHETKEDR